MTELDDFRVHAVTVRTFLGAGGMGSAYAAPVTLSPATGEGVLVDEKRRLVRAPDATQVISEATVLDPDTGHADLWAPDSQVTLPSGRVATVITVAARTSGDLDLPDHIEVALT